MDRRFAKFGSSAVYVVVYDKDRQMKEIRLHPLVVSPRTPPRMIGLSIVLGAIRDFSGGSAKHLACRLISGSSPQDFLENPKKRA